MADIEKEKKEQAKGPAARAHELDELTQIYEDRGISPLLARQVSCLHAPAPVTLTAVLLPGHQASGLSRAPGGCHLMQMQRTARAGRERWWCCCNRWQRS